MFQSKKKAAIKALQSQKEKLKNTDTYFNNIWVLKTSEILKKYFGEKSAFYLHSQNLRSQIMTSNRKDFTEIKNMFKSSMEKFIDECVEYINEHGAYKEQSQNFLSKIKVGWFVGLVFTGGTIVFFAGKSCNELERKQDIRDMQNKIEQIQVKMQNLKDSIRLLQSADTIPNKKPKPPSDNKQNGVPVK